MRLWRVLLLGLAAVCLPLACSSKHPASYVEPSSEATAGSDGGPLDLGGASVIPVGACGSQIIPAVTHPPNLSFIIDHSGSMGDALAGSGLSKYENARVALSHVLKAVGHRVNYGAAIFPGLAGKSGCEAGDELMKMGPGDPPGYARAGKTGPRLRDLLDRLSIANVDGGTPVAATLTKMQPVLAALPGDTFAVLITDGAPNCNAELACAASGCIPNIENLSYAGVNCTPSYNCCQPSETDPGANRSCVDGQASLEAVQSLAAAGIRTFVVGMPGSEPYVDLLDRMAELGGTAREGNPKYYSVSDTDALEQSLVAIAASVAISCEIPLDYEPEDRSFVNVYFDGALLDYDPEAGWEWTEDGHVAIRGEACEQLGAGAVLEVQVLAGCKTVVK